MKKLVLGIEHPDHTPIPTLTKLFHKMDLLVVAEGVETESQAAAQKDLGVDHIQRFFLPKNFTN